jgi:hypothetical protein
MKKLKKLSFLAMIILILTVALNVVVYGEEEQVKEEAKTADTPVVTSLDEEDLETVSSEEDGIMLISENDEETAVIEEKLDEGEDLSTRPVKFDNTISAEETKFSDENIEYESYYINGNVFIMGAQKVTIKDSEIDGNVFIMADEIELLNSTVNGTLFLGAVDVTLDITADSAYVMGSTITVKDSTYFNKDLKLFGENVEFAGVVDRDLSVSAKNLTASDSSKVNRNAYIDMEEGEFSEDIVLGDANITIIEETEENTSDILKEKLFDILASLIAILVIAIFVLATSPKFTEVNVTLRLRNFISSFFVGLLGLILAFFIAFMIMLTGHAIGYAMALIALTIVFVGLGKALFVIAFAIRLAGKPEKVSKVKVFFMTIFVVLVVEAIECLKLVGNIGEIIVLIFNIIIGISGFGALLQVLLTSKKKAKKSLNEKVAKKVEETKEEAGQAELQAEVRKEISEEIKELQEEKEAEKKMQENTENDEVKENNEEKNDEDNKE